MKWYMYVLLIILIPIILLLVLAFIVVGSIIYILSKPFKMFKKYDNKHETIDRMDQVLRDKLKAHDIEIKTVVLDYGYKYYKCNDYIFIPYEQDSIRYNRVKQNFEYLEQKKASFTSIDEFIESEKYYVKDPFNQKDLKVLIHQNAFFEQDITYALKDKRFIVWKNIEDLANKIKALKTTKLELIEA